MGLNAYKIIIFMNSHSNTLLQHNFANYCENNFSLQTLFKLYSNEFEFVKKSLRPKNIRKHNIFLHLTCLPVVTTAKINLKEMHDIPLIPLKDFLPDIRLFRFLFIFL